MPRGHRGIPYGETMPSALVSALHQLHIDGLGWMRIAADCECDPGTIRRALQRKPVTRETRERIERFVAAQKRRAA